MKNKFLFILIILCYYVVVYAQNPSLKWAKSIGSFSEDLSSNIALDTLGNIYITGCFSMTVDFDPSAFTFNMSSVAYNDIFISKFDALGNLVWVKQFGGTATFDRGTSVAIDKMGNVYSIGIFNDTVDFDPGAGIFNMVSIGNYDIYIIKLDISGNFLWSKQFELSGFYSARPSISVDESGNVYTSGYFENNVDFDPGPDTFNLTSAGSIDIFINKLDTYGNFVWAKQIGSTKFENAESITLDGNGNVYTTGYFENTVDFDPGVATFNMTSVGSSDIFINKLNSLGDFVWAKQLGGIGIDGGSSIVIDGNCNIYTAGSFMNTADFDPGVGIFNITSLGSNDIFISKLDSSGKFIWAKQIGGINNENLKSIVLDDKGNIYTSGTFTSTTDFDPSAGKFNMTPLGSNDLFICKLDSSGNFAWAMQFGGTNNQIEGSITIDTKNNIYSTGSFNGTVDFNPNTGIFNLTSAGANDIFIHKMNQKGVFGYVFNDINLDCKQDANEAGIVEKKLTITPLNIVVQTNSSGIWYADSLPAGTYTLIADTSGKWKQTCPISQNFTVTNSNDVTIAPSFGFVSTEPCSSPDVTIHAPFLRSCFSNQKVYVQACNQIIATGVLDSAYVEVQLDTLLTLQSASLAYTDLGNNKFRIDVGTLNPGMCVNFILFCMLSCNAVPDQTLCMQANLYPADSCVFDTITNPFPPGIAPCTLPWDKSSLMVEAACVNDSIRFVVYNTGDSINGNMTCHAPVRLYIDGKFTLMDSIQLAGGDSIVYMFSGDGRTWRLEADQHPKHPGNSHPNATIEACGNIQNWTSDLVNKLPMNDSDPVTDIYCGLVRGSYDPNDKTGYPYGVTDSNYIYPNQALQYIIRFQNTGTDTAFTVVVRDTLDKNLDIFTVIAGVSSHDYTFQMYGHRVLEWTFSNILLPDSVTDEEKSHGFVSFNVKQNLDLPNGTIVQNAAGIYFDFNASVITNQTTHTINDMLQTPQFTAKTMFNKSVCEQDTLNGLTYNVSGTYYQSFKSSGGLDSIVTFNLTVNNSTSSIVNSSACVNYVAPSGAVLTSSGVYSDTIPNTAGCDSVTTINLNILNSTNAVISPTACVSYIAPSGAVFTTSGTFSDTIPNAAGCDSIIAINLSINNSSALIISTDCDKFITPSGAVLTTSGIYSDTIPNAVSCDSIITINLTINTVDTTVLQNADTLTANESDATYQWVDCSNGNTISGETNQSYAAAANGSYAVIISKNGCTDTSACYNVISFGLIENTFGHHISIFPNPTERTFTMDLGKSYSNVKIKIADITGKSVYSHTFKQAMKEELDLNYPEGVYFLHIYSGKDKAIFKLVKTQ